MAAHESNGRFFYDHEPTEIDALTGGTSNNVDAGTIKASGLNVARNALLSSGSDTKSEKNRSVINLYSNRKPGAHNVSSRRLTDHEHNVPSSWRKIKPRNGKNRRKYREWGWDR